MSESGITPIFRPEICEWAVRIVLLESDPIVRRATIVAVAEKVGCSRQTLQRWVRKAEKAGGVRPGLFTTPERRLAELEAEVAALKRANTLLHQQIKSWSANRSYEAAPDPPPGANGTVAEPD